MKKRLITSLILAVLFALLFCACAEEKTSHKVEPTASGAGDETSQVSGQTQGGDTENLIVARVNGAEISYADFASQMASIEAMYSSMTDTLSADEINQKLTEQAATVVENLILQEILAQKTEEYDISLSKEQEEEVSASWDAMQKRFHQTVAANYPTLEGEELDEMVLLALSNSGIDEDMVTGSARSSALIENLRARVESETPQPTEEEIRAQYETLLSEQRAEFEKDETAFESSMLAGAVVVYIPNEYRVLREWEFRFEDDVIALLKQLKELDTDTSTAYEETLAAAQSRMQQTAGMVQSLLSGGSDFYALYENANPGKTPRTNYITKTSSRFSEAYYDAAMNISAPGSASDALIEQDYGYLLLYWEDTLAPGEVGLADVKAAISEELLTNARSEIWKQTQKTWRSEADVWRNEELITYG